MASLQVNLADHTLTYRLSDLIAAAKQASEVVPKSFAFLQIQVDPGAGAANVTIGDALLSSTRYGIKLTAGQAQTYESGSPSNSISSEDKFLQSSVDNTLINVEARSF